MKSGPPRACTRKRRSRAAVRVAEIMTVMSRRTCRSVSYSSAAALKAKRASRARCASGAERRIIGEIPQIARRFRFGTSSARTCGMRRTPAAIAFSTSLRRAARSVAGVIGRLTRAGVSLESCWVLATASRKAWAVAGTSTAISPRARGPRRLAVSIAEATRAPGSTNSPENWTKSSPPFQAASAQEARCAMEAPWAGRAAAPSPQRFSPPPSAERSTPKNVSLKTSSFVVVHRVVNWMVISTHYRDEDGQRGHWQAQEGARS